MAIRLSLCVLAMTAGAAMAQTLSYERCIDMAQIDPEATRKDAIAWYGATGNPGALHCQAIALAEIGATRSAARLVERVAQLPDIPAETRVSLFIQASELWRDILDFDAALGAVRQAQEFKTTAPLMIERATVLGERREWAAARAALDQALKITPRSSEALSLRAAARRRLGDAQGAKRDALQAIEYRPVSAAAWFELGKAELALGLKDAARRAWLKTIDLAPSGPHAALARGGLQDMDGGS